jgi:muramidase (phage lysozyme)
MLKRIKMLFTSLQIIKKIQKGELRDIIIKRINKFVDIPGLDEEQERKIFNKIYDGILQLINDIWNGTL